jgi:basic membrane protein A and related proteins
MLNKKVVLVVSILVVCSFVLASCASAATATVAPTAAATEAAATEAPAATLTVAVVAGGEVGDMGFIDSANEGLQKMESELGVKTIMIQTRSDTTVYLDSLISAAEQADIIFVIPGYFFDEQLAQVVPQFPDKVFVYVDGTASVEGMTSVSFKQNEGAFLAGALAALMTTDTADLQYADEGKTIAFMGGADMAVIHDYQVGFDQGAKYAVADINVIDKYAGNHFDAVLGKETALSLYEQGADIIFQAAGPTGVGVFEAAKDAKKYVIGVDSDQKPLAPEYTLASMRKNVGDVIFLFVQQYMNGEITLGDAYSYGLAENGVGIDYSTIEPDLVPQAIKDQIEQYKQDIINGTIVVDTYTAN